MGLSTDRFWRLLERNFPLAGAKRHLSELLGEDLSAALIRAKVLAYQRVAETYPCALSRDRCPRRVIDMDGGTYEAVCGNVPAECGDIRLSMDDIKVYGVDPLGLCRVLQKALQIRSKPSPVVDLPGAFHVGVFIPEPGVRHGVFLVNALDGAGYATAMDVLARRVGRESFAVLVPSLDIIRDETVYEMNTRGYPVLPLDDVFELDEAGQFSAVVDAASFFRNIGNVYQADAPGLNDAVAVAITHETRHLVKLSKAAAEEDRKESNSEEIEMRQPGWADLQS